MDEVTKVDMVFGNDKWLPKKDAIPEEFWRHGGTVWNRLFNQIFYDRICPNAVEFVLKEGVTQEQAQSQWMKIEACMRSWNPKHEHKEAGVAFMFSQVFESWRPKDDAEAVTTEHNASR